MRTAFIISIIIMSMITFGCAEEQAAPVAQESVSTQQAEEVKRMGARRLRWIIIPAVVFALAFGYFRFIRPEAIVTPGLQS